jgi:hypothetical protein
MVPCTPFQNQLGLDVLARLQGQVQQVFLNIRPATVNGAKTEPSSTTPVS